MSLFIGLMSGTSLDSIDAALLDLSPDNITCIATATHPIPSELRRQLLALTQPGDDEIERLGDADRALGVTFAEAVQALLSASGHTPQQIAAIGCHGQTIRHRPPGGSRGYPFTLQIGDPNTLAELTGITTVADFRRRDIAANGQGAPLAPAFHRECFHSAVHHRAIINIGGMANITLLPAQGEVRGFDCGPGNVLMDAWIQHRRELPFDRDGDWAAGGTVDQELLDRLLSGPFFLQSTRCPPRSTGREDFHLDYLLQALHNRRIVNDADVQATLLELTARGIHRALESRQEDVDEVYVCGGGAYNRALMERLKVLLRPRALAHTGALGMAPEWVEAAAFAWLAWCRLERRPGSLATVTGADHDLVLGGIYSA